jgi:hypothetical protein
LGVVNPEIVAKARHLGNLTIRNNLASRRGVFIMKMVIVALVASMAMLAISETVEAALNAALSVADTSQQTLLMTPHA